MWLAIGTASHHTFAFSFTKFAINFGFPIGEPSTGRPLGSLNMEVALFVLTL